MNWLRHIPWYVWLIVLGTLVFLDGAIFPLSIWSVLLVALYLVAWVILHWHLIREVLS